MHACIIAPIIVGAASLGHATTASDDGTQWVSASDRRFEIRGLPFFQENEGHWWRLPLRAQGSIPDIVWETSKSPSGARIRFRSDTTTLAIRYACAKTQPVCNNFSLYGEAGCDLYIDGQYAATALPPASSDIGQVLVTDLTRKVRTFCLYLPLYTDVAIEAIGLNPGAEILPAPAFADPRPVVFYGTSITQGGCAGRAGLSYEAMLCRQLNLDFVNLGFSGCGRGEPEVAELVAEVDASCYVLDFSQNNATVDELEEAYVPFITTLRKRRPDTPVLCITPIYWAYESINTDWKNRQDQMRAVVREAVRLHVEGGDTALRVVEGFDLLGPGREDGLIDGLHPNTLGFYWMAQGLVPHIEEVLRIDR
jgi:lysophospholipase L1-like esterase